MLLLLPLSSSKALLWSCTGGVAITVFPSVKHCKENSSPSSFSSAITAGCVFKTSLQYFKASSFVWKWSPWTLTPLPAVRPSGFITTASIPFKKFLIYSAFGIIVWSLFWGTLIYFLGQAALEILGLKFVVIFFAIWIGFIIFRHLYKKSSLL